MKKVQPERVQPERGCAAERHYANTLHVGFNSSEFLLDFAQMYDRAPLALHTRLVSSPIHVKQFAELLVTCLGDYEKRYGRIEALMRSDTADGEQDKRRTSDGE